MRYEQIEVSTIEGVKVVRLLNANLVDTTKAQSLGDELLSLVGENVRVLVDFADVEFLSSAVLGKLIALQNRLKAVSGQLKLCGLNPQIYKIFQLARLDAIMEICRDQKVGLVAFSDDSLLDG